MIALFSGWIIFIVASYGCAVVATYNYTVESSAAVLLQLYC